MMLGVVGFVVVSSEGRRALEGGFGKDRIDVEARSLPMGTGHITYMPVLISDI